MTRVLQPLLERRSAFMALLLGYFSLQLLVRLMLPDSLDLDEAEQLFQSQWWLLGYGPQPPLYNWLQQIFLSILGTQVLALALLKNLLLFATWSLSYLLAERCLGSRPLAALATLSLVLLPQISWESQRDLTHSVLVTSLAVATLYQGLRLLDRPSLGQFLLLGLLVGLGCNAKYSYLLFISAVAGAVLSTSAGRAALLLPALLPALGLALLLVLPHWWWLVQNLDLASESTLAKLMRPTSGSFLLLRGQGLLSLLNASLQFGALFLLLFAAFFLRRGNWQAHQRHAAASLLERYLVVMALVFLVFVLITGANFIKDRWMQPLLVVLPIWAFSRWQPRNERWLRSYAGVALVLMALIPSLLLARVMALGVTGHPERLNLPYTALMAGFPGTEANLLVTDRVRAAGNLRFQQPRSRVLAAERLDLGNWSINPGDEVWMLWDATGLTSLPDDLALALNRLDPAMRIEQLEYRDLPYHYGPPSPRASFGLARLVPDERAPD